jgi:transposase
VLGGIRALVGCQAKKYFTKATESVARARHPTSKGIPTPFAGGWATILSREDAADREAIVTALTEQIKKGPKSLVGNKGYRKYVKVEKGAASIDKERIKSEARFDGKWVLQTNMDLSSDQVALKYKELWQVERVFRDVKSLLETRPIFHQRDDTIRGHVFCSFLALVLRKELDRRLETDGHHFEWSQIKQDLKALQQVTID